MSKINSHYVPRAYLFELTGKCCADLYLKGSKKPIKKTIVDKDSYSNIGSIKGLYGSKMEKVMKFIEDQCIYPSINYFKNIKKFSKNFKFKHDRMSQLIFFIVTQNFRSPSAIKWLINSLKKMPGKDNESVLKASSSEIYEIIFFHLFGGRPDRAHDFDILTNELEHYSCTIHNVDRGNFCYGTAPIFSIDKNKYNSIDLDKVSKNWFKINFNNLHQNGPIIDKDKIIIVPISKNCILEFKCEEIQKYKIVKDSKDSIWFNKFCLIEIANSSLFLITSPNLKTHYLKNENINCFFQYSSKRNSNIKYIRKK